MTETTPVKIGSHDATEAAAIWVPIDDLTPWDENPRDNAAAVDPVVASIKRFGFASPIIARRADGVVIAGHTRLLAAKKLGLDTVPVRYMDLDPSDARLLAIVDNKSAEVADWDNDALADLLSEMDDVDLELLLDTGFAEADMDLLLEDPEAGIDQFGNITDGEPEFHTMNFQLTTEQKEVVLEAIADMKALGEFVDTGNTNANGNALARLAEMRLRS